MYYICGNFIGWYFHKYVKLPRLTILQENVVMLTKQFPNPQKFPQTGSLLLYFLRPSLILASIKRKIIISYFELDLRWYQNMQTFLKIRLTFSSRGRLNHQTFKMQSAPNSTSAFSCLSPTRLCLIFSMMVPYINYMCVSSTLFLKVIKSISDRNISRWFVC